MPRKPKKKANAPEVKKTKLSIQVREVLGNAYAFVQGRKFTESISSMTLESAMKEQIELIEGTEGRTPIRLNKLDQIEKITTQTKETVALVKKLPANAFRVEADDRATDRNQGSANTPEVPS